MRATGEQSQNPGFIVSNPERRSGCAGRLGLQMAAPTYRQIEAFKAGMEVGRVTDVAEAPGVASRHSTP